MDLEQAAVQQDSDTTLEVTVYAASPRETLSNQESALHRKKEELEKATDEAKRMEHRLLELTQKKEKASEVVEAAQKREEELEGQIATLRNRMQELLQKRNNLLGLLEEKRRDISAISSIPAGAEQYRDFPQSRLKSLLSKANDHLLKFDKVNRKAMNQFLLFSERVGIGTPSHG